MHRPPAHRRTGRDAWTSKDQPLQPWTRASLRFRCSVQRNSLARKSGATLGVGQGGMSGKSVGARVLRSEDPRLLRGRGEFVDDIRPPGMLHAAFVRAHHAHARVRRIDASAALAIPGVHAVFTAADMTPAMRANRMPALVPIPYAKFPLTQFALAADEVCYVGEPIAIVIADFALHRRRRRRGGRDRLRGSSCGLRLPRRGRARRTARASEHAEQRGSALQGRLWRCRERIPHCRPRVQGRAVASPRLRPFARRRARCSRSVDARWTSDGLVVDADAASRQAFARRDAGARSRQHPRDRARCRRRLRAEGDLLRRGSRRRAGCASPRPSGEMDRGPP